MAKPSKYNRARIRSRVRRPKRRGASRMWAITTAAIVIVGVALVVLSYNDRQSAAQAPPKLGDHWHAFLGFDVCGNWLHHTPADSKDKGVGTPAFESTMGIHSHGDGLMHIHPFSSAATGKRATVGRFLHDNEGAGWDLSATSMVLWDGPEHRNGAKCGTGASAKPAEVQWIVGHRGKPWPTKPRTGDPASFRPADGDIIGVYFLPKGDTLVEPPGAEEALKNITDVAGSSTGSTTTGTGGTPASTPGSSAPGAPTLSPSSLPRSATTVPTPSTSKP